jgi:hypothetical protein
VKQLTELMKTLMLMNPNLSIATSSEQDVGNTNLLARQSTDSFASISSSASSTVNVSAFYNTYTERTSSNMSVLLGGGR